MQSLDALPDRPLKRIEVRRLSLDSEIVSSTERLYYHDTKDTVVGFFLTIDSTGYMLGFSRSQDTWTVLSSLDTGDEMSSKQDASGSIIEWFEDEYDEYAVFGAE